MTLLRITPLALVCLLLACNNDEGDSGAGLFGEGGDPPATSTTGSSSSDGTTNGLDDGEDPPPPPPATDDGTTMAPPVETGSETSEGSSGASTSGDTGFDTTNDGTLEVEVVNQSMFPQGQCDDVFVTNVSAMPVTWEVELPLPGIIDQLWNAEVVEMEATGVFNGLEFNAELAPGMQAMFGYCVTY